MMMVGMAGTLVQSVPTAGLALSALFQGIGTTMMVIVQTITYFMIRSQYLSVR